MWETVKLGELVASKGTGLERKASLQSFDKDFPYLKMNNITNDNALDISAMVSVDATSQEIEKYRLHKNDFLFNTRNSVELVGKSAVFEEDQLVLFNNNILRVKFISAVNAKYVNYFLTSAIGKKQLNRVKSGTTNVAAIYYKDLQNIEILLPPLAEQQRIVAKLDAAFAEIDSAIDATTLAIEQAKIGLGNLIDEKTSKSDHWNEYKVSDLGLVQTGNTPKTSEKDNYGNDIAFVKPPHFRTNGTIEIVEDGLSVTGAKSSRKASANSVMMVCIGATIGKVAVCHEEVCFNQQINSLSPAKEYDAELIYWQMRGNRFQKDVRERAGQATLPIISKAKWANLSIYLPSSAEAQVQIRSQLRGLSDLTEKYCSVKASKIDVLHQLKSAILAQELQPPQSEAA